MRSRPARHPLHGILVGLALAASGAPPSSARSEPYALDTRARAGVPVPGTEGVRGAATRTHVLLQLADGADRAALADRGVRFLAYVPRDTWLASVPPGFFDVPTPAVRWADRLTPHDRLHPEFWSAQLPAAALRPDARAGLYVRFFDDVPRARARSVLAAMGAQVLTEMQPLPAFEIAMDPRDIERLATIDEVLWIRRRTPPMQLANDGIMEAAHIAPLHAPPYELDGTGTVIGVWDGGKRLAFEPLDARHRHARGKRRRKRRGRRHAVPVAGRGFRRGPRRLRSRRCGQRVRRGDRDLRPDARQQLVVALHRRGHREQLRRVRRLRLSRSGVRHDRTHVR